MITDTELTMLALAVLEAIRKEKSDEADNTENP